MKKKHPNSPKHNVKKFPMFIYIYIYIYPKCYVDLTKNDLHNILFCWFEY